MGTEGPSVVEYSCEVDNACNGDSGPRLSASCGSSAWPRKIPAADDWYFAAGSANADVNLYLQRYEYKVENSAILSSCIAGGSTTGSCIVAKTPDVSTYLLKIGPGESSSIVEASTSCATDFESNVGALASLAIFVSATFLLLVVVVIFGHLFMCQERRCRPRGT